MADTKFAELKTAIRQAELQREIADLPSSPKALRYLITILSEQGTANLKTETGFGYLRALTQITKTLEDIPARLWGRAVSEIDYVLNFAEKDSFLAPNEFVVLQDTATSLKTEITRQAGLGIRTASLLARGVARLGEGLLERGASSRNLFVRMGSKLALAAIERQRTTKEVGKEFARTRAGALGAVSSYRTAPTPSFGMGGDLGVGGSFTSRGSAESASGVSPQRIDVDQLNELKKINKTLARQIKVAETIDEENDKQRVVEQSRMSFTATEASAEAPRMTLAGAPSSIAAIAAKESGSGIGSLIASLGTGIIGLFSAPEVIGALAGAIAVAAAGGVLTAIGSAIYKKFFGKAAPEGFAGGRSGGAGGGADFGGKAPTSVNENTKVSDLTPQQLDTLIDAQQKREGFLPPSAERPRGSVSYRHNNPGNIKWPTKPEARKNLEEKYGATRGEVAKDGGYFAKFPSIEKGREAQKELWRSPMYAQLPLGQALSLWSGGGKENTEGSAEARRTREIYRQEIIREIQQSAPTPIDAPLQQFELPKTPSSVPSFKFGSGIEFSAPNVPVSNFLFGQKKNNTSTSHPRTFGVAPMFLPDIVSDGDATTGGITFSLPPMAPSISYNRNASPVSTLTGALTSQGQNVVVMNAPTMAPIVNVQGGGSTVVPMPIRTEPLENTLLALTRLNYV